MALTTAQKTTLKAYILGDATLNAQPNTNVGNSVVAAALNALASPEFVVWKTSVSLTDVGKAFNGAEWAGMTSTNHTRLQSVALYASVVDPSKADIRAMFDDIWSGAGGATTRTNLAAVWKRAALLIEKVFATGTGTTVSPATMGREGSITADEIEEARAS